MSIPWYTSEDRETLIETVRVLVEAVESRRRLEDFQGNVDLWADMLPKAWTVRHSELVEEDMRNTQVALRLIHNGPQPPHNPAGGATYGCGCTAAGDLVGPFCAVHGDRIQEEGEA